MPFVDWSTRIVSRPLFSSLFPCPPWGRASPALARRPLKQKLKGVRREVRTTKNENAARPAGVDLARAIFS